MGAPVNAPSDNVWIGDLPIGMDKGSLATLFEPYGQVVECRILAGKGEADTAKPAAMVRFASVEMATWIVENLNGNIPEGLNEPIVARFANAERKGGGKGGKDSWGPAKGGDSWGGKAGPYGGGGGKGGDKGGEKFSDLTPSDNVWVGDLPVGTDKPDLEPIFVPYGQIVECRMLPGRDPSAKPCAMIRFASVEMATWVVQNLNGNIPEGLNEPIVARFANSGGAKGGGKGGDGGKGGGLQYAQPWAGGKDSWGAAKGGGKGKNGGGGGGFGVEDLLQAVKGAGILGGGKAPDDCQCFVKNLPTDTTDLSLYMLFAPFGAIPPNGVKAMMNPDGSCKGIGFVDFTDPTAAATAVMTLNDHAQPDGSLLGVATKKPSTGKGKGEGKGQKGKW